jgi:hypothetical protein
MAALIEGYLGCPVAVGCAHIRSREDVWLATGGEITDWYRGKE